MDSAQLAALIDNPPPQYQPRPFGWDDDDQVRDECGVFGVFGHAEAARLIYLGLYSLQHRGQEGAGIVCAKDGILTAHRGVGLVADVFKPHKLARVKGSQGIGHVRYSTAGGSDVRNVQPMIAETGTGPIAIAHNGNLVNGDVMRKALESEGAIFASRSDTEIILHLLARARAQRFQDRVRAALAQVTGAYSLLLMHQETIIGIRDPSGFRPLVLGKLGESYVLASEPRPLDLREAPSSRALEPGEMVLTGTAGVTSEPFYHAPDQ